MKTRVMAIVIAALVAGSWTTLGLAQDERARILGDTCAGCHGTDGASPGPIATLEGLSSEYIAAAMYAFREDRRPATVMNRIAKGFTDEEIELLAQYFAVRGANPADGTQ